MSEVVIPDSGELAPSCRGDPLRSKGAPTEFPKGLPAATSAKTHRAATGEHATRSPTTLTASTHCNRGVAGEG